MKLLRLAPENTKFGFMRFRRVSYPFSAVLSIISVVLFLTVGMNFGIDFVGGTLIEVRADSGHADLAALRHDRDLRQALRDHGLATIRARHTCAHRVDELMSILARLDAPAARRLPA